MGSRGLSNIQKGSKYDYLLSKLVGRKGKGLFDREPNLIDALKLVNPNYDTRWLLGKPSDTSRGSEYDKWARNCAITSTAGALQIMGYDVEALARTSTWRGFDSVFEYDWKDFNSYLAPKNGTNWHGTDWHFSSSNPNKGAPDGTLDAKSCSGWIDKQMQSWGTHSVAIMNVQWNSGGGHAIVVYREKYKTSVFDFQTHQYYSIDQFFTSHKNIKFESTGLYRMDNQKLKTKSKDAYKMIKRRKKNNKQNK